MATESENLSPPQDNGRADNAPKEFVSNPNSYWGVRIRKFASDPSDVEGLEKFKDTVTNDAAAWGIFAALLMTVGFAGVLLSEGDWKEDLEYAEAINYAYIAFQYLVAMLSFLAVIIGTLKYSYFGNLAPSQMDEAVKHSRHWNIAFFVYGACGCQTIASVLSAYLLFGTGIMIVCVVITVISLTIFGMALINQKKSYQALNMFVIANN
eukprot:CAMPEP_0197033034 /NCGR_PEP_ID=MMETSP1384-20130603/11551_1 /TAXON_ID=29189 /ORGANISM="Ammonia sp." /LENGTH=208 /DNA_ID=CAMNT_0042462777 /DNA_START=37 /DNA_END=663 /DNA_ORIENTATION=+